MFRRVRVLKPARRDLTLTGRFRVYDRSGNRVHQRRLRVLKRHLQRLEVHIRSKNCATSRHCRLCNFVRMAIQMFESGVARAPVVNTGQEGFARGTLTRAREGELTSAASRGAG